MAQAFNYGQAGFSSLYEELAWRGLISQSTDEEQLASALNGEPLVFYCGFDPTAASLTIGNLVVLIVMRHLQLAGHHPIALVGGTTGLIGDPRQSGERKLNDKDVVAGWVQRLGVQIGGILDTDGDNPVRLVNNYDWTSTLSAIDFLRDVGKNFRVGTMMNKEIVARRLSSEEGISFAEFSYQILQAYDYLHLYDTYGCTLQVAGNDQWGNATAGLDLIRKVRGASVNVFTSPLITDAQGKKFGKSEGNAVWLDPEMFSPYRLYQFWYNQPDDQMDMLLKAYTFLPRQEIEELVASTLTDPGARKAQRALAWEVTSLVHGEQATQQAIDATSALFGRGGLLEDIDVTTLEEVFDGLKPVDSDSGQAFAVSHPGERVAEAGMKAGLFPSISEARKTIRSGGVYVNNVRVADQDHTLSESDFLHGRFALLRRGKRSLGVVERR